MNILDAFPSKYLKLHELQGKEPIVTIARVALEAMGRTREVCPVVYFVGKSKGLKLNKTMATAIAAIAGSPLTEAWVGAKLQLFGASATFGDQAFPVIRIKAATAPRLAVTNSNPAQKVGMK
jgi:hypothetical protein